MHAKKISALALGCALCWAAGAPKGAGAANPLDRPGEETTGSAPQPAVLQSLLPSFTATPLDRSPDAEGWGPLRLSPAGRFCLSELEEDGKRSVFLLDQNAVPLRDLTRKQYPLAGGLWGYSDQHILMECRRDAAGKPLFLHMDRVTGSITPSTIPGVPRWSPTGHDYLLPAPSAAGPAPADPDRFQRFTGNDVPVGHPLIGSEPAWSADGQWLAFLAPASRPEAAAAAKEGAAPAKEGAAGAKEGAAPRNEGASRPGTEAAPASEAPEGHGPPEALGPPEIRAMPVRGDVPRVILGAAGWGKLMAEKGWGSVTGTDQVTWSPAGDALFAFCTARLLAGGADAEYLLRLDLRSPKREILAVPAGTRLVSASGDTRHWILQLGDRLYRLDFAAPPVKKNRTAETRSGGD